MTGWYIAMLDSRVGFFFKGKWKERGWYGYEGLPRDISYLFLLTPSAKVCFYPSVETSVAVLKQIPRSLNLGSSRFNPLSSTG